MSIPAPAAAADAAWLHSAFYRFTPLDDPAALAQQLRRFAVGLLGSVVVAPEGLSGAVAGSPAGIAAFEAALQQPTLQRGALGGMAFQHSACRGAPFGRLKVSVKPEAVALGLPRLADGQAAASTLARPAPATAPASASAIAPAPASAPAPDASHLGPVAWQALLARPDLVLLDNRNHFEFRLGRFKGALDPQVHNFRDFSAFVLAAAPAWREAGRPVAMYCTGGIRCDKTAPWMRSLGLEVWQLDGGILGYLQHAGAADSLWQGECFVFDRRIALDAGLNPSGIRAEQVFDPLRPDEVWRLQRARRLDPASA